MTSLEKNYLPGRAMGFVLLKTLSLLVELVRWVGYRCSGALVLWCSIPNKVRDRGFTLIELTFAVLLLTILAVLILPSFSGLYERARIDSAAQHFTALINYARYQAVLHRKTCGLDIDLDRRQFSLPGHREFFLDKGLHILSLETPRGLQRAGKGFITFFPNGTSEEAEVIFQDRGARTIKLTLNPLTARVKIIE